MTVRIEIDAVAVVDQAIRDMPWYGRLAWRLMPRAWRAEVRANVIAKMQGAS